MPAQERARGDESLRAQREAARGGASKPRGPRRELRTKPRGAEAAHSRRARLCCEKQSREPLLGDDGDLAQNASHRRGAQRLLCGRVLPQERQHLGTEPSAGLHHEGDKLRVRVLLGRVPLPLVLLPLARCLAGSTGRPQRSVGVLGARVGVRHVDVRKRALVVPERYVELRLLAFLCTAPISKIQPKIATNFAKLNIENSVGTSQFSQEY